MTKKTRNMTWAKILGKRNLMEMMPTRKTIKRSSSRAKMLTVVLIKLSRPVGMRNLRIKLTRVPVNRVKNNHTSSNSSSSRTLARS